MRTLNSNQISSTIKKTYSYVWNNKRRNR